ncbi:MAG: glycosyltransferase, partial [Planctomycetota bacterium]
EEVPRALPFLLAYVALGLVVFTWARFGSGGRGYAPGSYQDWLTNRDARDAAGAWFAERDALFAADDESPPDCDALVAPALWGETQTSLCRVALAAGRPVVASRTPGAVEALPSSCARFVTPGSAEELAAELTRLAGDGTAFADLARAAVDSSRSTKSTDDEAREWLDTYTKVVEETLPRRGVGRRS